MAVGAIELYVRNEDGELVAATLAGVDATLAGLSDVNITDPQDGDVLSYDTDEWVNVAGGGSDPWAEGPNLVTNGDFETADISLWEAWFFPETITRETVSPITGTGSLKLVTTADDKQGIASADPQMPVTPGDRMRYRITLKGSGLVQTQIDIDNSDGFNPWFIIPLQSNPQIYTLEFIVPSDATEARIVVRTDSALVVTAYIDDIYFGVLTAA